MSLDADPAVMRLLTGRPSTRAEVVDAMARRTRPDAAERGLGYWAGSVDGTVTGWWALAPDPGLGVRRGGLRARPGRPPPGSAQRKTRSTWSKAPMA